MTHKQAQQIKEENAKRDSIARAIADARVALLGHRITSYNSGDITAHEFLSMTDNILLDELKQSHYRPL